MRRSSGMSLLEVLIAGAILLILLTLVADLFTTVYRHQRRMPEEIAQFRENAVALARLGRELRQAEVVYAPDLATAIYDQPVALPLRFRYHARPGLREVVYTLQGDRLMRNGKVVAHQVASATVTSLDPAARGGVPFARFTLTLRPPAKPSQLQLDVALERP